MQTVGGTDDDVIKFQQNVDLGHHASKDDDRPAEETEAARRKSDREARRALGRDLYGRRRRGERAAAKARRPE